MIIDNDPYENYSHPDPRNKIIIHYASLSICIAATTATAATAMPVYPTLAIIIAVIPLFFFPHSSVELVWLGINYFDSIDDNLPE